MLSWKIKRYFKLYQIHQLTQHIDRFKRGHNVSVIKDAVSWKADRPVSRPKGHTTGWAPVLPSAPTLLAVEKHAKCE